MAKGRQGRMPQGGMMAQVQQMQARLAKAQEEIAAATVEGTSGGGAVKVVMSGSMACKDVVIAPELLDDADVAMLQDLVVAAVNQAIQQAQVLTEDKMAPITGGLGSMMGFGG